MRRFLSIVEHELDCEDLEPVSQDEEMTNDDAGQAGTSGKLSSVAIVAVEVKPTRVADDDDDGGGDKDAAEDDDDDEAGSRLVVIDKTRFVPHIEADTFIS